MTDAAMLPLSLILMRHAKSDWNDPLASDHDRVLNERGRASAPAMGRWLAAKDALPDQVLVSSAARTRETLARLGLPETLTKVLPGLYLAQPERIIALIRAEASGRRVLVLGHNSGISEAAAALVATRPKHRGFLEFPTCATLISDVSAPRWSALGEGMLTPCHFAVPREVLAAEAALQGKN